MTFSTTTCALFFGTAALILLAMFLILTNCGVPAN